jgi:site-specific recombinase XerD
MSKPHATLSPLSHRGAQYIKVDIPNNDTAKTLIRQVTGRKWSQTHHCWYVPYTAEAYRQLKELFEVSIASEFLKREITLETVTASSSAEIEQDRRPVEKPAEPQAPEKGQMPGLRIEKENDKRVKVYVPWQQKDWIEKIKTLPGRAWNQDGKYWSVPLVKTTISMLNDWFGSQLIASIEIPYDLPETYFPLKWKNPPEKENDEGTAINTSSIFKQQEVVQQPGIRPAFQTIEQDGIQRTAVVGYQLIVMELDAEWLAAYLPYDKKEWLEKIKAIRGRKWVPEQKLWKVPYCKESLDLLRRIAGDFLVLTFRPSQAIPDRYFVPASEKTHRSSGKTLFDQLNEKQKAAVSALEKQLTLERKSYYTIKGYRNHFIQFLWHHRETLPSQISDQQIREYFYKRIKEDHIAKNTQSQLYSSLASFYARVLDKPEKMKLVQRPEKDKTLPRLLTKEEVKRLLAATDNLKHKCLLAMMYGSGLRVGEVVRLKTTDVDYVNLTVFIENSKGNKDRYSLLSGKCADLLKEYCQLWKPKVWLFEGEHGEPYSERSVQQVFKRAMEKARIGKRLGTHALRHSFATHLTESGIDLDFLRKLLGHSSIKTTQVYLHVSKDRLRQTKSPMDDIGL